MGRGPPPLTNLNCPAPGGAGQAWAERARGCGSRFVSGGGPGARLALAEEGDAVAELGCGAGELDSLVGVGGGELAMAGAVGDPGVAVALGSYRVHHRGARDRR